MRDRLKLTVVALGLTLVVGLASSCGDGAGSDAESASPADMSAAPMAGGLDPLAEDVDQTLRTVRLSENETYVADATGRPLYARHGTRRGSELCSDDCLQQWTPFGTETGDDIAVRGGAEPSLVGVINRPDGEQQITYGGHPLYYHRAESGPLVRAAMDGWGDWVLVGGNGELLVQGADGS